MMRPRGTAHICVSGDGNIFLTQELLDELREAAQTRGISARYVGWDIAPNGEIELWPVSEKNQYVSKIQILGPRRTTFFKSRRLAQKLGRGKYEVNVRE